MTDKTRPTLVYHVVRPRFRSPDNPFAPIPAAFELVAEIETDDLEEAFRLTNSEEQEWWFNDRVFARTDPCRSTSVGDVIVLPDGEAFIVNSWGYRPLGIVLNGRDPSSEQ